MALWCFNNMPGEMTAGIVAGDITPSEGTYCVVTVTVWYGFSLSQIVGTAIQHLQKGPM